MRQKQSLTRTGSNCLAHPVCLRLNLLDPRVLHPVGTESALRYPALTASRPSGEALAKRCPPRAAAHGLMARRRGPGDPPRRKMIPASLLHIAGGYSPLTTARLWPALSPSWTLPSTVWWEPRSQEHFNRMAVRSTLDAKACPFRYGRPLPGSRWPYGQLGHVNRRQPGCDKRASVRRSLQEMQRGGCSKDPSPPRPDCHRMILTASARCRTA